jgi:hypothetical protein
MRIFLASARLEDIHWAWENGLVVTPSSSPVAARSRISEISAVSAKNFISISWLSMFAAR